MKRTRLSFFYLIGYLSFGGVGLLAMPDFAIRLLGSNASYPSGLLRLLGGFMIALALIVAQIVRHRVEVMYATTLMARVVLLGTILWVYFETRDPLFLSLTAIVGLGMILTGASLATDRKAR